MGDSKGFNCPVFKSSVNFVTLYHHHLGFFKLTLLIQSLNIIENYGCKITSAESYCKGAYWLHLFRRDNVTNIVTNFVTLNHHHFDSSYSILLTESFNVTVQCGYKILRTNRYWKGVYWNYPIKPENVTDKATNFVLSYRHYLDTSDLTLYNWAYYNIRKYGCKILRTLRQYKGMYCYTHGFDCQESLK